MVNRGEFVVNCVANRGVLHHDFWPLKVRHSLWIYFRQFPIWESGFEVGDAVAVAKHEREEFAGLPVAGSVAFGLGYGAEQPAEVELVGPSGNVNLVTAEKG